MKMKTQLSNRILSLVLTLVIVLGMMPMSTLTAFAEDDTPSPTDTVKAIQLGTSGISGYDSTNGYDYIYYGTWGSSAIKWRVLSTTGNGGSYKDASGADYSGDALFLLSDVLMGTNVSFDGTSPYSNAWQGSNAQAWCIDFAGIGGSSVTDAFTAAERNAVLATTKNDRSFTTNGYNFPAYTKILNGDRVFFLSAEEAANENYGFIKDADRIANYGTSAKLWWLRSRFVSSTSTSDRSGSVSTSGKIGWDVVNRKYCARPAFNLNLNSVLFTSAAVGGKYGTTGIVTEITTSNTAEWKLTLKDSSRNAFEATLSSISDNTVTVSYSDAKTGDNEYISAIIKNGSTVKYYGRLGLASESGTATVTLPDDFNAANGDVLCIFNEQYNGDYKTDYASELIEIGYKVSFDANGGTGTMDSAIAKLGADYPLPANGFDAPNGYKFSGWATTASGDIITTDTITITANTTLYAVWEMLPAEAPTVEAGSNLTLTYKGYTDQQVSVSVTKDDDYTYSYQWYDGNGQLIKGATNSTYTVPGDLTVGSYSYYCRVMAERIDNGLTNFADSAKITVTVNKATPGVTAPTAKENLVYDGSEQALISAGSATNGTIQYALGTAEAVTGDWKTDIPKATKAGTYYVWYKVVGNDNYNDVDPACITVTVAKAKIIVKADDKSKTYGDTDPTLTYTLDENTPLVSGESLSGISANRVSGEDANTYTITASEAEGANPNYDITFVDGTFTINQREIEIEWTNTEFTYDGNEKLPTATVKNLVSGDTCNITVAGGKTDAGTGYVATAESVDNNNYKLPSNNTTTFVIKNASQDAPVVTGVSETIYGKKDGKITDLTSAMEYRKEGESTYTAIQSEELTNLAAGTYYVRYAAKANHNASDDTTVVIGAGRMLNVTVPTTQTGYTLTTADAELEWNGSTTITFALADGYSKTDGFAVKVNGNKVELTDNKYTVTNAQSDVVITVDGVADITAPEVEMSVKGVGWKQFINKVTFGLFFKENVEIKVEATDLGSKIKTAEYLITETAFTTEDAVKNDISAWTTLTLENGVAKINVTEKGKKYVYVRVTDNAGNITVVSSDGGMVVYTDSTADTTAISFTKTTTDDVTAKVNLNGNTVKAIYNGTDLVDSSNYSVAADGTITFKAAYLDTLAEDTYTLHIVYNPQGEEYGEYKDGFGTNINDEPEQTNITLTVVKQTGTVSITNDISKTYDGTAVTAPTYDRNNVDGTVVVEYKQKGADDNTYSTDAPKNAGDYTVRVIVKADDAGFYTEAVSAPVDFTIGKATLTVTAEDKTATYGDAVPSYTEKYDGFANGEDKNVLGDTLNLVCDYAQFSDKGEYTIKASGYTSDNYNINYVDGKLTVNAKPITVTIQNATSIYGDALAELKATDEGIINGDANVYSLATTATSTSNVGKYAITGTALDSNYAITFANEDNAYEITKREITITVEAKNTIVNTALPTYTYKVDGLVGEDKLVTEPTLTSDADVTVIGEYDITAIGADAGGNYSIKYVPAKLTVLTDNAVDAAAGYAEELKDYDPATVTSEDKAELEEMLSEIDTILADETTTDNGKKALEEVKEKVKELIKEITDAEAATDTENTEKVKDVTAENVTPDNKTDLEGAKADLEKALDEHGNNMTEEEKKAIEDEIKRINDALEVIGNVEAVEELIDKLPENITKDDEAAIKAADDAYNALTDYEKSLVDKDAKKSLDDAKAALAELNKPADTTSPNTGDNSNLWLWVALLFISGGAVITLTVVDRKRKAVNKR